MLTLLTSRLGIATVGLLACLTVGGVQQLRLSHQALATASAQAAYEREAERARHILEANQDLAEQISTQNAEIEAMATAAAKRDQVAAARVRALEVSAAARRAARVKGQGPEYLAARLEEIRRDAR